MQKLTTCLWFDNQAEEAMNFYVSIFNNSEIGEVSRYGEAGPGEPGSVMVAMFTIEGQRFMALNGGPHYHFTPAISMYVDCKDQSEVDALWDKLIEGGTPIRCGWLTDKFGLSLQIIPKQLTELLQDPDPEKSGRVMQAMLKMVKIDVAGLQRA